MMAWNCKSLHFILFHSVMEFVKSCTMLGYSPVKLYGVAKINRIGYGKIKVAEASQVVTSTIISNPG